MSLRERWKAWPWDVRLAYTALCCFIACIALTVVPFIPIELLIFISLLVLFMILVSIALILHLLTGPRRRIRILPLALICSCVVVYIFWLGESVTDLWVIGRVYWAGGPVAINDWGQEQITKAPVGLAADKTEEHQLPDRFRNIAARCVLLCRSQNGQPVIRLECGGGHFHYGLLICPIGSGPPLKWWQQVLGWPPEVIIYHE